MPRAKPNWSLELIDVGDEPAELPNYLKTNIKEILAEFSTEKVDVAIRKISEAIHTRSIGEMFRNADATYGEKIAAARQLAAEANSLADKLPWAGGAGWKIGWVAIVRGTEERYLVNLKNKLRSFAAICEESISHFEHQKANNVANREAPRDSFAESIATLYQASLGESPAATTVREHSRTHPYVLLLKLLLEFCEERKNIPLTTVEHVARNGIRAARKLGAI